MRAVVLTISTRAAAGIYDDTAGPRVADALRAAGFAVEDIIVIPDGRAGVSAAIVDAARQVDLVVTNGGTGVNPKDETPEATLDVVDRVVPGLGEVMRAASLAVTPMAALSRGVCGTLGSALVVNLPGSPKGAVENLQAITAVLAHAVDQLHHGDHTRADEPGEPDA